MKKTVLTGLRPTGKLHLGHYFGAIKQWVEMQDEYEMNIELADVQGLTDNFENPKKVRESVYEVAKDLLSCGINPESTILFIQSQIPEIAELTVYYSNLVTVNRLFRNPTVKNEVLQKTELFGADGSGITYGFLGYPVSQAADITVFNADIVPVGDDQIPMIEQTREIVKKFNSIYSETLKLPEYKLGKVTRLKGLDGGNKMGKSLNNAIYLSDSEEEINKKVMNAVTDPNKIKKDDIADPKKCMVFYYHELFSNSNIETIKKECENGSRGCVNCKKELCTNINNFLTPIKEKRKLYDENPDLVKIILTNGTNKAKLKAEETMKKVKQSMQIDY